MYYVMYLNIWSKNFLRTKENFSVRLKIEANHIRTQANTAKHSFHHSFGI